MVVRTEVLDQVILARKTIAAFAGALVDGTVAEDREVNAGLVTLQICEAGKGLVAVVACERLRGSGLYVSRLIFS